MSEFSRKTIDQPITHLEIEMSPFLNIRMGWGYQRGCDSQYQFIIFLTERRIFYINGKKKR